MVYERFVSGNIFSVYISLSHLDRQFSFYHLSIEQKRKSYIKSTNIYNDIFLYGYVKWKIFVTCGKVTKNFICLLGLFHIFLQ